MSWWRSVPKIVSLALMGLLLMFTSPPFKQMPIGSNISMMGQYFNFRPSLSLTVDQLTLIVVTHRDEHKGLAHWCEISGETFSLVISTSSPSILFFGRIFQGSE